ncbi:MAG: 50S ribosomal protein L24 [Candidatus Sungbacteria bacterium]|uniref:Large ribosomal subunit protein uL24 n=1 Tax=Candidatus Sungiibacteriota bacterium TaxID=2750080 RepID=A0A932VRA7_9BACT|nr:50S ribosomal protein L24 [Candidatus Sungbacteria bacterium]
MQIRKGDRVKIISGNDKGKQGKVLGVFPRPEKIVVEGVNVKKKHVRPRRQGERGELVRIPAPFAVSRAMIVCPSCGRAVRVGRRQDGGEKIRICKKCGETIT